MNKIRNHVAIATATAAALASSGAARMALGEPMEGKEAGPEFKSMDDVKAAFLTMHKDLKGFIDKANDEIKAAGSLSVETKNAITQLTTNLNTLGDRLDKVEAKGNRIGEGDAKPKSLGDQFIESKDWGENAGLKGGSKARMEVKAITNATGQNQPLVPSDRVAGVIMTPNRRLRIRDLLPRGTTTSNLIEYAKENVFTNSAGPQNGNSPTTAGENLTKPESDITFTLATSAVVTIAHFILASRQVLDDAPMLASYINGRLQYGLALEEEDEILNGDGTVGQLNGLMNQATAYNRATTGTKLDWLRRAITQLQLSEYDAEVIILNPADWEAIELLKDTTNQYIIANPQSQLGPMLWGLPVIATNTMASGQFLVANLSMAAQLWDRQAAAVEVSREDSDNFRKNMVTLLCEERLALTVYRATALIKGVFSV